MFFIGLINSRLASLQKSNIGYENTVETVLLITQLNPLGWFSENRAEYCLVEQNSQPFR
jgi:hypothetical protein